MKPDDGVPAPGPRAIAAPRRPSGLRRALRRAAALAELAFAAFLALAAATLLALAIVRVGGDWLDGIAVFAADRPRLHPRQLAWRGLALDVLREILLVLLVIGAARWRDGPAWRRTLALAPGPGEAAPCLSPRRFALILLVWPLVHITWVTGSAELFHAPIGRRTGLSPGLGAGDLALWFAYILVLAPLAEELLMRGALYARARAAFAPAGAILATAALFALAHSTDAGLARAVSLIPLALILGWVRWRSGRLWPSIVLHGWSNLAWVAYLLAPAAG